MPASSTPGYRNGRFGTASVISVSIAKIFSRSLLERDSAARDRPSATFIIDPARALARQANAGAANGVRLYSVATQAMTRIVVFSRGSHRTYPCFAHARLGCNLRLDP